MQTAFSAKPELEIQARETLARVDAADSREAAIVNQFSASFATGGSDAITTSVGSPSTGINQPYSKPKF